MSISSLQLNCAHAPYPHILAQRRALLRWLGAVPLCAVAMPMAFAAASAPASAFPAKPKAIYLTHADFVRNALQRHFVPAAQAFAQSSQALAALWADAPSIATAAWIKQAQQAWLQTLWDWETLSAVSVGPLVERRSARKIDFWPTRPAMIEAAVAAMPQSPAALTQTGAPAKGLPALEWLLWQVTPSAAQLQYAKLVAIECAAEAQAIAHEFAQWYGRIQHRFEDEEALPVLQEWVGQLAGGLDQLRWKKMDKPAKSGRASDWPRATSRATQSSWLATWRGLERLLIGTDPMAPQRTTLEQTDAMRASFYGLLLGGEHLAGAHALGQAVQATAKAMAAATPKQASSMQAALTALGRCKQAVDSQVAQALHIVVGFSDADGD
jgi:predicted lipoprotein